MAKGAVSKTKATEAILNAFPGSFTYDKEIRIPFTEDGEEIQLKCVLTCAKVNVEPNGDVAIPGAVSADINFEDSKPVEQKIVEPTQEEKDNVRKLMETFGL